MADSLSTIGSIASYIVTNIAGLPQGISGNAVIIVDLARQYVSQYTGVSIGSNAIPENYQSAIVDFAMSDTLSLIISQYGGTSIQLGELRMEDGGQLMSPDQYRKLGEMKLRAIGRHVNYARSLS